MKKTTLFAFLLIVSACTEKKDDLLTLEVRNGAEVEKELKFDISSSSIKEIEELNLNKNEDITQFLTYSLYSAKGFISVYLNNPNSYDFIDNSIGNIYVLNDTIKISFHFTSQNGFGNNITSKANLDVYNKDGKVETDVKIE